MPIIRSDGRGWARRLAGVAPGALLTAVMLLAVVDGLRWRSRWLSFGHQSEPRASERVVFVASPATAAPAERGRSPVTSTTPAASAAAPSPAPIAIATPIGPLPAARDTAGTSRIGGVVGGTAPRAPVGPVDPRPVGATRPPPAPLDRRQLDSALATVRGEMAAQALRGRIPLGTDDAGKALAPLGASEMSAAARRDLARAAIVDWQRRDAAAQLQEKGRRPALTISRRLSFGGPRPPALSDAEVRAMFERNQARVRRRADSLAWWAESTRVARERVERDAAARDSAARGAPPVEGDV